MSVTQSGIPLKYKVQLAGRYNPGVYICPDCNFKAKPAYEIVKHFLGFADSNMGTMAV